VNPWKTSLTFVVWLGCGAASSQAAPNGDPPALWTQLPRSATRGALLRVARGALQRLESDECRRVFSDFADGQGRTLQANLDALGQTPAGYLRLILFTDGSRKGRCQKEPVLAVTSAESRVVFLCPERFERAARQNHVHAEAILIHETLHTLGLGENPPTSNQITDRVLARCR